MNELRINSQRLWQRLEEMASIGATVKGGCNRQALTDEDKQGRDLFIQLCEAAGCHVRFDEIGNIFARRVGNNNDLPPVMTGSHLDTQPTGGKYDGAYGVLAGLEVVESLNDAYINTEAPIEVVVWTNEEGCRFDVAMLGSAVWSQAMSVNEAYALEDLDGRSLGNELERIGYKGSEPATAFPVKAVFELHIEQGPILEREEKQIGIVTGVQHMSRHRIDIRGQEAHAGPTPMRLRRDPMMAIAEILPQLYALADKHEEDARITFGYIKARPGSPNTVPGEVAMTADIRHPDTADYETMLRDFHAIVKESCRNFGLQLQTECIWEAHGVSFDTTCVDAVRRAVELCGYSSRDIVSGAGHDACNVSAVVPTSMIFIPCKDGLSHNEAEYASPDDVAAGCNVLLNAMLTCANS